MPSACQPDIAFGPFRLDTVGRSLTRDGKPVSLGGRALDVLAQLAVSPGETIAKNTLLERVWPGLVVEDNNLQVQISTLRKTLGDGWIVTVPGRGYRLLVPAVREGPADVPAPSPDKPSIAVLPFANMSARPEQEYFSDGMADDIITELSRSRLLFVIARNSSFSYKGREIDVKQVARDLGVRYLLEGSVREIGDRVRVNARLIDAVSGKHLWAERYDRDRVDVFAVQDEITHAVTVAIEPAISHAELRRALRKPSGGLDAWEAYQRGLWHLMSGDADGNARALNWFHQATVLDPTFATPHAMVGYVHLWDIAFGAVPDVPDQIRRAETAARRAIELDFDDPVAHAMLSWATCGSGRHDLAIEHAERALSISPNEVSALLSMGRALTFGGRPHEAKEPLLSAIQRSPNDPLGSLLWSSLAASCYFNRDYAGCVDISRRIVRDFPGFTLIHRWLAAALGQMGSPDAYAALHQAIKVLPTSFEFFARQRPLWFRPEDHALYMEGLRKAGWRDR